MQQTDQTHPPISIACRPITPSFGAEITGVDLTKALAPGEAQAIQEAWLRYGVLLFRGEDHDDEAQMRLSRIFGELEPSMTADMNDPTNPYMLTLHYDPDVKGKGFQQHYNVGGKDLAIWLGWHWDQTYMPTIVRGAVLRMTHPARTMGETGFIDAIEAYDRLPEAMKRRIENLEVVYEIQSEYDNGQFGFPKDIRKLPLAPDARITTYDFPPSVHPLVITHPDLGRKVLKLSPKHSRYILGMDRAESDALLHQLADHLVDTRFAYFHSWGRNDMMVWDNWRMIHCSTGVPLDCKRSARRTTIVGDYNLGRYLDPALDRERKVKRLLD